MKKIILLTAAVLLLALLIGCEIAPKNAEIPSWAIGEWQTATLVGDKYIGSGLIMTVTNDKISQGTIMFSRDQKATRVVIDNDNQFSIIPYKGETPVYIFSKIDANTIEVKSGMFSSKTTYIKYN